MNQDIQNMNSKTGDSSIFYIRDTQTTECQRVGWPGRRQYNRGEGGHIRNHVGGKAQSYT